MKKPNYGFEKHQKEMKRKKKQEEKMRRKLENAKIETDAAPVPPLEGGDAPQ